MSDEKPTYYIYISVSENSPRQNPVHFQPVVIEVGNSAESAANLQRVLYTLAKSVVGTYKPSK